MDHPENRWCKLHGHSQPFASSAGAFEQSQSLSFDDGKPLPYKPSDFFLGLDDALRKLRQDGNEVRGVFHWHGWHNGDSYDFWNAGNAWGAQLVQRIMSTVGEAAPPVVNMIAAPVLELPEEWSACPKACRLPACTQGNGANGGNHLSEDRCTHRCSKVFSSGQRFCGTGSAYEGAESVDCSSCALPPRCSGLPCWNTTFTADWHREWPIADETQKQTLDRICQEYPDNTWCIAFKKHHTSENSPSQPDLWNPWDFPLIA